MKKKYIKFIAALLSFLLLVYIMGGCKKTADSDSTDKTTTRSASVTNTKTASASSSKTTINVSTGTKAAATPSATSGNRDSNQGSSQDSGQGNVIPDADGQQNADSTVNEMEDQTPYDASVPDEEKYDLKGKTILVGVANDASIPVKGVNKTRDIQYDRAREVEAKYNCKVDYIMRAGTNLINEFATSAMAGVYFVDIVYSGTMHAFPNWSKNNLIVPLDDYIDFNNGPYGTIYQNGTIFDGKHWGISIGLPTLAEGLITYNKEVFAREGLQDLFELQEAGQWTWDTFVNIASKAVKDMNGDGIIDQYGLDMYSSSKFYTLVQNLAYSNGTDLIKEENGRMVSNITSPEYLKAFYFASDLLLTSKVIPPGNDIGKYFKNGSAAMFAGSLGDARIGQTLPVNFGLVLFPKGPDVSDYACVSTNQQMYCVAKNVDDVKVTARILADLYDIWNESKSQYITYDEMLNDLVQYYTDSNVISTLRRGYDLFKLPPSAFLSYSVISPIGSALSNDIVNNNIPPKTAADSYNPQIQEEIDRVYNIK